MLTYTPNNEEGHKRLIAKLKELMQQQTKCNVHGHECHEGLFSRNMFVGQRILLAGVAHQVGTVRFGNDLKPVRWTLTARRTTWTISTSSTAAFSVLAAR